MSEIKMTVEARTDYDCEVVGLPAQLWAEALFKIENEEGIHLEIIAEKNPVIHIIIGDLEWRGTIRGLKQILEKNR